MRTSSDLLWKLINSMSAREKLYFRRNFTDPKGRSKSLYLRLFDAVSAQKEYDEAALLKKFQAELNRKNLPAQKHYLYRQLCEALLICDSREDATTGIYRDIQLVRMLRKKGLLDEAHELWKKTVARARRSESFAFLNLLKSEFSKMILFSGSQTREDEHYNIFKGNIISYDEYTEMMKLRDIYTEVLLLKRKGHYDIDEPQRDYLLSLLNRVTKNEDLHPAHSFWYRHYLRMSKATLLYLLNEHRQSLALLEQSWNDWKDHPHYLLSESEYFIEILYMINYAGILEGRFDFVLSVFNDPVNEKIGHAQRANFEAVRCLALNKIYNKSARYRDVEKLIADVKTKYRLWEPMLNADMNRTLTLSIGISSLVLEKYDDAIYFINRGLAVFRQGARQEHESLGHLLLLLSAWSMNNARFFDAQYRSTYQYFYKRQKKKPYETLLLQCFQRTFYMKSHKEKKECFRKTLAQLEVSGSDKVQNMVFNIFNFPGWLAAQAERIPYRNYVEKTVARPVA